MKTNNYQFMWMFSSYFYSLMLTHDCMWCSCVVQCVSSFYCYFEKKQNYCVDIGKLEEENRHEYHRFFRLIFFPFWLVIFSEELNIFRKWQWIYNKKQKKKLISTIFLVNRINSNFSLPAPSSRNRKSDNNGLLFV